MAKPKLTVEEEEYELAKTRLKTLTASWYLRMSGQVPWRSNERREYEERFKHYIGEVHATYFASLPSERAT